MHTRKNDSAHGLEQVRPRGVLVPEPNARALSLAALIAVSCALIWRVPGQEQTALQSVAHLTHGTTSLATHSTNSVASHGTASLATARAHLAAKAGLEDGDKNNWLDNYGQDEEASDTVDALMHNAKKRLSLAALLKEVLQMKRRMVGDESLVPDQPQRLVNRPVRQLPKRDGTDSVEHDVKVQANELKAEGKEIRFLEDTMSAHKSNGASFVSYLGKTLASAGFTGSSRERLRLKEERRNLAAGWAALDKKRAARAAHKQAEDEEFAAISRRLQDLEKRQEEDTVMASSRRGAHDQNMKVSASVLRPDVDGLQILQPPSRHMQTFRETCADMARKVQVLHGLVGTLRQQGDGGRGRADAENEARGGRREDKGAEQSRDGRGYSAQEARRIDEAEQSTHYSSRLHQQAAMRVEDRRQGSQLDFRPPPYPHPPGHGRPGQGGAREQQEHQQGQQDLSRNQHRRAVERSDEERERRNLDEDLLYYNKAEEVREARGDLARRDDMWGDFRRLRRDSLARGAFGGVGRVGDGVHVVHAEERGDMTSAADMPHMSLPAVFPSDLHN